MSDQSTPASPSELTRRAYAALNGRDFGTLVQIFGPDSVWDVSRWGLGTHRGQAAIGRFLEDWFDSFASYEVQVPELFDRGGGVVEVLALLVAQPAGSRERLRLLSAAVFRWDGEMLGEVTLYPDLDQGREAAARLAGASSPPPLALP
jgi:ketosteroid isomerase-like protein